MAINEPCKQKKLGVYMRSSYKGIGINTTKNTHEKVFSIIAKPHTATLIDIPSGHGAFTLRLNDAGFSNVVAMDIENILKIDHANFLQGDMTKELPMKEKSTDMVVCIDGIEHISEQFLFTKEVNRVLKVGGEFIVSTPNISSLRSRWKWITTGHHHKCNTPLDEANPTPLHHKAMISFPEMRYLLHSNGFKINKITTNRIKPVSWLFALLLPFVFLSTAWVYFKKRSDKHILKLHKEVFKQVFKLDVLFGETLIVKAEKVSRSN